MKLDKNQVDKLNKMSSMMQGLFLRVLVIEAAIVGSALAFDGRVQEPKFMGFLMLATLVGVIASAVECEEKKDASPDRKVD